MKIVYLVPFNIDMFKNTFPGVYNKIISQNNALEQISKTEIASLDLCDYKNKVFAMLANNRNLIRLFISKSKECEPNDVIYIRDGVDVALFSIMIRLFKSTKVVFEIQTIYLGEMKNEKSNGLISNIYHNYRYYSRLLFEKYMLTHSDGIVGVTNEITSHYKSITENKIKYITNGNGIETARYKLRVPSDYDNTLHVLMVANVNYWHGIDRFINGMHKYAGNKNIILHIVGCGPTISSLKLLTEKYNLTNNVIFHGFKSRKDLDDMFDMCHIAICTLAPHRANLTELSSLKTKEYCVRGIPFLMACKDTDIPDGWEYTEIVPSNESPIDMNAVISFADRVLADPDHPQKMRKFAEEHLDWLAKMKVLKGFLETL